MKTYNPSAAYFVERGEMEGLGKGRAFFSSQLMAWKSYPLDLSFQNCPTGCGMLETVQALLWFLVQVPCPFSSVLHGAGPAKVYASLLPSTVVSKILSSHLTAPDREQQSLLLEDEPILFSLSGPLLKMASHIKSPSWR